jgi:hypothetical protein
MNASWAGAVVALIVALAGAARYFQNRGRREGKLDAILEHLATIAVDHEDRLRDLEKHPSGRPDAYPAA